MFDVIEAIHACYAPIRRDGDWIDGVLATLAKIAPGLGAWGIAFTPCVAGGRFEVLAQRGDLPDVAKMTAPMNPLLDEVTHRALMEPYPAVELFSKRARRLPPAAAQLMGSVFQGMGAADVLGIFGGEPDLRGVLISIMLPRSDDFPGPRTLHLLRRLSAHLTSARRLREATSGEPPHPDAPDTDAVLAVSGRVEHATGPARATPVRGALSEAVRRIEWARGRARRTDPEEAARAWRGLVAGMWTLVDHVERDGRRYVLARRNPPPGHGSPALTEPERAVVGYAALGHSNKYIAYLLGISPSTVAKRLGRAEHKLGAPSRRVLIEIMRGR